MIVGAGALIGAVLFAAAPVLIQLMGAQGNLLRLPYSTCGFMRFALR